MKNIITDTSLRQLESFIKKLDIYLKNSTRLRNDIDYMLADALGDTYTKNEQAKDFFDKFGNNMAGPVGAVDLLKMNLEDPAYHHLLAGDLDLIRNWDKQESDKAVNGETMPEGMKRSINNLSTFIEENRRGLSEATYKDLKEKVSQFAKDIHDFKGFVDEATRLHSVIALSGRHLAQ